LVFLQKSWTELSTGRKWRPSKLPRTLEHLCGTFKWINQLNYI
jgi:hypothetical protein